MDIDVTDHSCLVSFLAYMLQLSSRSWRPSIRRDIGRREISESGYSPLFPFCHGDSTANCSFEFPFSAISPFSRTLDDDDKQS